MTTKPQSHATQIKPNLDAELGLLAIVLGDNAALPLIADKVRAEHFGESFHAVIYQAIASLISEGIGASPLTLRSRIETHPSYAEVDGATYLARVQKLSTPASDAPGYITALLENYSRRAYVSLGESLIADATSSSTALPAIGEAAAAKISGITEALAGSGVQKTRYTFAEAIEEAINDAATAYQHEGLHPDAVMTGIRDLDSHIGGFMPGELIIIAGRPGAGKTALAVNICLNAARLMVAKPTLFISLEMSAKQLASRQISAAMHQPKVPYSRIIKGKFSEAEFNSITDAARFIAASPMDIIVPRRASIQAIENEVARAQAKTPNLAAIAVDYLGLIATPSNSRESRTTEIGAITAGLKGIGRRFGLPVIALAQLSREVEKRDDKRPQLSDLRESGSIEQDADVILFPFREEYYLSRHEPKSDTPEHIDWQAKMANCQGVMEIIVGKFRMGATTTIKVRADMATNTISDFEDNQGEMF